MGEADHRRDGEKREKPAWQYNNNLREKRWLEAFLRNIKERD
jgi:hypothetical protein